MSHTSSPPLDCLVTIRFPSALNRYTGSRSVTDPQLPRVGLLRDPRSVGRERHRRLVVIRDSARADGGVGQDERVARLGRRRDAVGGEREGRGVEWADAHQPLHPIRTGSVP